MNVSYRSQSFLRSLIAQLGSTRVGSLRTSGALNLELSPKMQVMMLSNLATEVTVGRLHRHE